MDLRRETAEGKVTKDRRDEIPLYIAQHGERLIRVATSGLRVPDETKMRILSTVLALINLRENLDRGSRHPPTAETSG